MDKKYKLIEDEYSWYKVIALKDFTLITGEQIKKGDVGGRVESGDCLSQEGLCWIMDDAYVFGKVFENAVIKDHTHVGEIATVTGNAVVQAYQRIHYGTVTADLLGTKDWTAALYAEFGIVPENGKITLYKRVWNTNNPNVFESVYNRKFIYEIGKEAIETDVDEDVMNCCGKGLHFTSLKFIGPWEGNTILECEVDLKDIITIQYSVVRARKCKVIRKFIRK